MDSIEQLFAEVYTNPDDDHLRRVLADALLAIGDPRGELILFQLEPDKDYHRRAMRLIQAHGLSWLGALRGTVIPLIYERGFLASAAVLSGVEVDFDHPMWGTVHTIDLEGLDDPEITFRITPAMRSLKMLIGMSPTQELILRKQQPDAMERLRVVLRPDHGEVSTPDNYDPVVE